MRNQRIDQSLVAFCHSQKNRELDLVGSRIVLGEREVRESSATQKVEPDAMRFSRLASESPECL